MGEVLNFPLTNWRQHAPACKWNETDQPWDCSCGAIRNPQSFLGTKERVEAWERDELPERRKQLETTEQG